MTKKVNKKHKQSEFKRKSNVELMNADAEFKSKNYPLFRIFDNDIDQIPAWLIDAMKKKRS